MQEETDQGRVSLALTGKLALESFLPFSTAEKVIPESAGASMSISSTSDILACGYCGIGSKLGRCGILKVVEVRGRRVRLGDFWRVKVLLPEITGNRADLGSWI